MFPLLSIPTLNYRALCFAWKQLLCRHLIFSFGPREIIYPNSLYSGNSDELLGYVFREDILQTLGSLADLRSIDHILLYPVSLGATSFLILYHFLLYRQSTWPTSLDYKLLQQIPNSEVIVPASISLPSENSPYQVQYISSQVCLLKTRQSISLHFHHQNTSQNIIIFHLEKKSFFFPYPFSCPIFGRSDISVTSQWSLMLHCPATVRVSHVLSARNTSLSAPYSLKHYSLSWSPLKLSQDNLSRHHIFLVKAF